MRRGNSLVLNEGITWPCIGKDLNRALSRLRSFTWTNPWIIQWLTSQMPGPHYAGAYRRGTGDDHQSVY